jgi:hypothetical protein
MSTWLSPTQIADVFAGEMEHAGGRVIDTFKDEARLFVRSLLPSTLEVGPGDGIQGGVALRATETDISVHPYTFRQVCTNGAIMARATQTRHIVRDNWFLSPDAAIDLDTTIRAAIRHCCQSEAFSASVNQMRSAKEHAVDMALMISHFMSTRNKSDGMVRAMTHVLSQLDREGDRSAFGFMNAITATARETRDPELKWQLEELGGGVPSACRKPAKPGPRRARARSRVAVTI